MNLNISTETICKLGEEKGIVKICEFKVVCRDSYEDARRDYDISIKGLDCFGKEKTLFYTLTEWEELDTKTEEHGDNQTQE